MTRMLSWGAFALGGIIVLWMGSAFIGSNLLALVVTLLIGGVYCVGFVELLRYQQATGSLVTALDAQREPVADLNSWLSQISPALQNGVRLRIQGEHVGLPVPVLTPYLVGLLVMLGLLGTFVGMVDTLKGAVSALEGTTELEAIRAGLAAPIRGLGMAFGTSVAGVSASAMLGFISTLSRRDRMLASRQLDGRVASVFQQHSLAYNRQQTYQAMQQQAEALPAVAEQLTALATQLGRMGDELGAKLESNQQSFHQEVQQRYTDLADAVEQSLKHSLAESGRLAGESIRPAVQEVMEGIGSEARASHERLSALAEQQLQALGQNVAELSQQASQALEQGAARQEQANDQLLERLDQSQLQYSEQFARSAADLLTAFGERSEQWLASQQAADQSRLEKWNAAFEQTSNNLSQTTDALSQRSEAAATQMLSEISRLFQSSEELVKRRADNEAQWLANYNERMDQLAGTLQTELGALRDAEAGRGAAAVERLAELETAVAGHLADLGAALEAPMARLIETASEAPRAAAELIEKLRAEMTRNIERDNALLEERCRTMEELNTLSGTLEQASNGQREAIEKMVEASASMLSEVGERFSARVDGDVSTLNDIVQQFSGSAIELASLGEAFGAAVQQFGETSNGVVEQLGELQQSLDASTTRSDEQLAYYVAQAREIIDHSVMSQQAVMDQLRQLSQAEEPATAEAC